MPSTHIAKITSPSSTPSPTQTHTHALLPSPPPTRTQAVEIPKGAYSLEDAKLKNEEDAKRTAAEELKEKVRMTVQLLRRDYAAAIMLNQALPEEVRGSDGMGMIEREMIGEETRE